MYRVLIVLLIVQNVASGQMGQDTIAYSINLDEYVVTAQYEPTHFTEAIHKVDIISKDEFGKIGAVNLKQALTLTPSIRLYEDPILGTSIRMRGMSATNVAILMDGIPVIGRNNGGIDISQLPLHNVERIEVVEGPLSNIYGNNAAGGVINIITTKSQLKKWSISQNNQLESTSQRNHTGSIGFQQKNISLSVSGRYFNYNQHSIDSLRLEDEIRQPNGAIQAVTRYPFNPKTQYSFGSQVKYSFNDDNNLVLKYDQNKETVADYGVIKRPQFKPYATDQFYKTVRNDLSLMYKGKPTKSFHLNMTTSLNKYDRTRDDKRYLFESKSFDSLFNVADKIKFSQIYGRADLSYIGWNKWVLMGGYNYTLESGEGDKLKENRSSDSINNVFHESAFFSDLKYKGIKNWQFSLSNRFINHSYYSNAITTAFQLKYDIKSNLSLRASVGQGYRSPSLKELFIDFVDINHNISGNINLKPERSIDFQTTLSYEPYTNTQLSINGYYTKVRDQINLTEFETLKYRYDNIDSYSSFGFQPSASFVYANLNMNASLSLNYWSTNIITGNTPDFGQVVDMNNSISYEWERIKTSFIVNHRYVGSQPIFQLQNEIVEVNTIKGYHLIDFSASKGFLNQKMKVIVGVRNLLDLQTTQVSGSSAGMHSSVGRNYISIGRSYFVNFGYSLK